MSRFIERLDRKIEVSPLSALRRHIVETSGLTPEQYLEQFGDQIRERLVQLRDRGERRLTVAIPAADEEGFILKCLKGIADQVETLSPEFGVDVVVVSQSEDRTTSLARQVGAVVIEDPKRGLGRARKQGFAHAEESELIFFIDADSIPVRTWLASMLIFHQNHPSMVAVYGPSVFSRGSRSLYAYNFLGEVSKWVKGHYCGRNCFYTSVAREIVVEDNWDLIAEDGRLYKALKKRGLAQGWNMSLAAAVLTNPRRIEKEGPFKAIIRRAAHLLIGHEKWVARQYSPDADPNDPDWAYTKKEDR